MIYESGYWKDALTKRAKELRRHVDQRRWSEASFGRLERTIMLGFYEIRKLVEAKKLSNINVSSRHPLIVYTSRGKPVTLLNWHHCWELYDLDSGRNVERELPFICNQIVHSYVFIPCFDNNGCLEGVIVSSDHKRNHEAYFLSITRIVDIFERVGKDYPNTVTMRLNPKGDYNVHASISGTDAF